MDALGGTDGIEAVGFAEGEVLGSYVGNCEGLETLGLVVGGK